ncbi:unnamed protein product, partial [Medioppia subpectinata]
MNKLNASVKHWETIEMNMMIFVWYHKDNAQPDHYPHDFMADCKQKLIVMENAVDEEHLITVHANIMPGVTSTYEKQTPAKVAGAKSITGAYGQINFFLLGRHMFSWLIKFTCYTPLYCINYIDSVSTVNVNAATPIRPNQTALNVLYFAPPGLFYRLIAELAMFSFQIEVRTIEKDNQIWEALRRPKRPIFTSNDELIVKRRPVITRTTNRGNCSGAWSWGPLVCVRTVSYRRRNWGSLAATCGLAVGSTMKNVCPPPFMAAVMLVSLAILIRLQSAANTKANILTPMLIINDGR